MDNLIRNWQVVRAEIKNVRAFQHETGRPKADWVDLDPDVYNTIVNCDGWSYIEDTDKKWWNFPIIVDGKPTERAIDYTPQTIELLKDVPGVYICGYSLLFGRGIITPHVDNPNSHDPNGSLTCHLGLVCPDWNYLIQHDRLLKEEDGKLVSFNHTHPHSAVNLSESPRVVLYMSFR
jgi:aspartyl/asparaginyl beta-hydroxylase (cupin superfamily)